MRRNCLYNGNYVDIAEIYEVRDGKQINIPEKLKYYRKLSGSRQLFCPCGCGEVVILVAGVRNLMKQHFRLLRKSVNSNCKYQEEGEISVNSKIMLKCWLNNNLPVMEHEIKYRVPISQLVENERRYELSVYSEDYDIGIIYNKQASSILEEKVELLSEYVKSKIVYVTQIENEETKGQYPEHMMRIQEAQGYCFYLDLTAESLYEEVKAKVSIYAKTHRGLWEVLDVCQGMLDDFGLNTDGTLVYKGELISDLVDKRKGIFQTDQEHELEQIRKREEEEIKRFLAEYPKFARVYTLLKETKIIEGVFFSDQGNGEPKSFPTKLKIDKLIINRKKHRIEIFGIEIPDNTSQKAYIYILESGFTKKNKLGTGALYTVIDYTRICDVENYFRAALTCIFKEGHNGVDCSVSEIKCQYLDESNVGACEKDCTYQKR